MARILVVEDEFLIASMLQDCIEELGHEVVGPAATVAEALKLIERQPPEFAILDLTLGKEQSLPVADALDLNNCKFAFATGHGAGMLPDRFKTKPALRKPFMFEDVKKLVADIGR